MNMKKEYRLELRQLARAERKLNRDCDVAVRTFNRQIKRLRLAIKRGYRATERELDSIARRRAILEGRLAS